MTARLAGVGMALALLTGAAGPALAAGQSLGLTVGLGSLYDSNLLGYSDAQRSSFEAGIHPERYSIETLDDLTWNPAVMLAWESNQGHGRRHVLRLRWEADLHQKDVTADFHSFSAGWREHFRGERRLALGYYRLPNYYLRQLEFSHPLPGVHLYERAEFDLGIASASWSQRLGRRVRGGVAYQHETRTYNDFFPERSSRTHQGELSVGLDRLPARATLDFTGAYRSSRADAGSAPAPHDVDLGYHGAAFGAGARRELGRLGRWRLGADVGYEFEARTYLSERPADKYHYQREDRQNAAEAGLRAQLRPHWVVRGFYRYENNHARLSSLVTSTAEVGSYTRHQAGLSLEWSGLLWRQVKAAPEEEE